MTGRDTEAVACFHQISSEPGQEIDGELENWICGECPCSWPRYPFDHLLSDFKCRWRGKLGDSAMNAKQYDEAVLQYTTALLLDPASPQDLLVKRSKACAKKRKWEDALNDANEVACFNSFVFVDVNGAVQVIRLDPSSPSGYERKYTALLGMAHHHEAIDAFKTMLSKMSESPDPEIRGEGGPHYTGISPLIFSRRTISTLR